MCCDAQPRLVMLASGKGCWKQIEIDIKRSPRFKYTVCVFYAVYHLDGARCKWYLPWLFNLARGVFFFKYFKNIDKSKQENLTKISRACYWNATSVSMGQSILSMQLHTRWDYCSSGLQNGTQANWLLGNKKVYAQDTHTHTNTHKRIRKQLYMSWRGFSSAKRRAWTNSWMKLTCILWTRALPSYGSNRSEGGMGGRVVHRLRKLGERKVHGYKQK